MATKKQKPKEFYVVSGASGLVLEASEAGGDLALSPPARPAPPRQRWRIERGVRGGFVNAEGLRAVLLGGQALASDKAGEGTPLVLDIEWALRAGEGGVEIFDASGRIAVASKAGKKARCRWSLEPIAGGRPGPAADPGEKQQKALFTLARLGGKEEHRRFAALFKRVSLDEVEVRVGTKVVPLEGLLSQLQPGLSLALERPFKAPLLWDADRARLLMIDCAERTADVFDRAFYGRGQGARVLRAARGIVTGESDETERAEASEAAREIEPWDQEKMAQWACLACLDAPSRLDPATCLGDIRQIRSLSPSSLDDSMSGDEAEAAELAWQVERLWGYLTGAIPCARPSPEQRRLLAAQLELRRVEGLRKALLSRKATLEKALARAKAENDTAASRVLKQALALLR